MIGDGKYFVEVPRDQATCSDNFHKKEKIINEPIKPNPS